MISRPRRIKSQRRRKGRAQCHCLQHRHYTALPPVAQQGVQHPNCSLQAPREEQWPGRAPRKSLQWLIPLLLLQRVTAKLQQRQDLWAPSLGLAFPKSSSEYTVGRTTCARGQDRLPLAQDRQTGPGLRGRDPPKPSGFA